MEFLSLSNKDLNEFSNNSKDIVPKIKIRQIDFRTHVHATESPLKVIQTLKKIIPEEYSEQDIIIEDCIGSFGQKISSVLIQLKTQKLIKKSISHLGKKLNENDKNEILNSLALRLDRKYKFYFRIDKQKLALENINLGRNQNTIQVIISIQNMSYKIPLSKGIISNYFKEINLL